MADYDREDGRDQVARSGLKSARGDDEPEVNRDTIGFQLTRIQGHLEFQRELLGQLEEVVNPVLRREFDDTIKTPGEEDVAAASEKSIIAENLEMYADRIDANNRRLNRLINRVSI